MQKISYINQMNGFMARCSEDALPANAVVMYLMLFNCFNRSCWRNTWMRFTIQQLMAFTHVGSPNTVYNMRRLLKELGYIDYRDVKNGMRAHVEYRLVPLGISSRNGSGMTTGTADITGTADMTGMAGITSITGITGMTDMTGMTNTTAGMTTSCAFADIPCDNRECSANERSDNEYANSHCSVREYAKADRSNSEHSNSERSISKCSNSECSVSENSKSERSISEYSVGERSKSEYSNIECSKNECSLTESSINAPAKAEYSHSKSLNSECSISENSHRRCAEECSGQYSGECSKSERQPDNSPNREEKEKTRYTSHDTSLKYGEVLNNNNNLNYNNSSNGSNCNRSSCNSNNSNDSNDNSSSNNSGSNNSNSNNSGSNNSNSTMSVSEFYRTNGDYLLCQDAYREYFKHEPPSEDRVRIIRFLADYGVDSTLSAMDVMIQHKAASLSYCETILRQSQWKINRKAIRRPAPSKEWEGWQMA